MNRVETQVKEKRVSLRNLTIGNWISLAAGVVFIISIFLPWYSWKSYATHMQFSLSAATSGDISSADLITERVSIPVYGTDVLLIRMDADVIILSLVSLLTTIICLLCSLSFFVIKKKKARTGISLVQIGFSILGLVPFAFIPSMLGYFREITMYNYPEELPRSSTVLFGAILAILACIGLVIGAILAYVHNRKRTEEASLLG
jgi:hypothetical protein